MIKINIPIGINNNPSLSCTFQPFEEFVVKIKPKYEPGIKNIL